MLPRLVIGILHTGKKLLLTPERIFYTRFIVPSLVKRMRSKEKIDVAFVVFEVASWKTENLFNRMMSHPRFSPQLLVVPSVENKDEIHHVEQYLNEQGYPFHRMLPGESIQKLFHPDIIFYQKPYNWCIDNTFFFRKNLRSLFCYMSYCFRNTTKDFNQNSLFHNYAWQVYVENESVQKEMKAIMDNAGKNTIVTGLAVMDDLMKEKSCFPDPWKELGAKKRIIYAPHHTICNELVHRSTFLSFGDFMLEIAKKYEGQVQWAFKPHPLLKVKLDKLWGKERADAYYEEWSRMENSQFENGEYMGLFKYSDAMIHDSGSFMLEYLYTGNPVMFLITEDCLGDGSNQQTHQAFEMHYQGRTKEDIESFIKAVIAGEDPKKVERETFYQSHLIPPGGCTACDNVIKAILGTN